jgi:peroxisomal membrane protein 4
MNSWKSRAKTILRATKTHALNLAKFVSIYKALLLVQKKVNNGKERSLDTFVAGLVGGYYVFGERTAINEQVRIPPSSPLDSEVTRCRSSSTYAPV